jgi:putative flippase GtrA
MRYAVAVNRWPILGQLVKYCIVAVIGIFLHLGLIAAYIEIVGLHYTGAFIASLPFTFLAKFACDKYWTFKN